VGQADSAVMQASFLEETSPQDRGSSRGSRGVSKTYRRPGRDAGTDTAAKEPSGRTSGFHPWESATIDLKERSARGGQKRAAEREGTVAPSGQADPFDPEAFNRQYSSSGRPARGPEAADRGDPPPRPAGAQGPDSR
jgi:hypothetical protein